MRCHDCDEPATVHADPYHGCNEHAYQRGLISEDDYRMAKEFRVFLNRVNLEEGTRYLLAFKAWLAAWRTK